MKFVQCLIAAIGLVAMNAAAQQPATTSGENWIYGSPFVGISTGFAPESSNFGIFPIDEMKITKEGDTAGVISSGDAGIGVKFCETKSTMYCVNSPVFSFAVPKTFPNNDERWTQDNVQYWLFKKRVDVNFVGRSISAALIIGFSSKENGLIYEYIYSRCGGLIGYRTLAAKTFGVLEEMWLQGSHGFAAHTCK
ncbi:MAG: hypothetical protein ACRDHZ_15130 [Ktedonobacteraceae bacterium]